MVLTKTQNAKQFDAEFQPIQSLDDEHLVHINGPIIKVWPARTNLLPYENVQKFMLFNYSNPLPYERRVILGQNK